MPQIWDTKKLKKISALQKDINRLKQLPEWEKLALATQINEQRTLTKRSTNPSEQEEIFEAFLKNGIIPIANGLLSGSIVTTSLFPFFVITDETNLFLLRNAFEENQNNILQALKDFLKNNKELLQKLFSIGGFYEFAQSNLSYNKKTRRTIQEVNNLLTHLWKIGNYNKEKNKALFTDTILNNSTLTEEIFNEFQKLQNTSQLYGSLMTERLTILAKFNNKYNVKLNKNPNTSFLYLQLYNMLNQRLDKSFIDILNTFYEIREKTSIDENNVTFDALKIPLTSMLIYYWDFLTNLNDTKIILKQMKNEEGLLIKIDNLITESYEQISIINEIKHNKLTHAELYSKINQLELLINTQKDEWVHIPTFIKFAYHISNHNEKNIFFSSFENESKILKMEIIRIINLRFESFMLKINDIAEDLEINKPYSLEIKQKQLLIKLSRAKIELLFINENLILLKNELKRDNSNSQTIEQIDAAIIILYEHLAIINPIIATNNIPIADLKLKLNEIKSLNSREEELLSTTFSHVKTNYNLNTPIYENEQKEFSEKNGHKALSYYFLQNNRELWQKIYHNVTSTPTDKAKKIINIIKTNIELFNFLYQGISENDHYYNKENWMKRYSESLNSESLESLTSRFEELEVNRLSLELSSIEPSTTNINSINNQQSAVLNPQPLIENNSNFNEPTNLWKTSFWMLVGIAVIGLGFKFFKGKEKTIEEPKTKADQEKKEIGLNKLVKEDPSPLLQEELKQKNQLIQQSIEEELNESACFITMQ